MTKAVATKDQAPAETQQEVVETQIAITPMQMLQIAVEQGADLDKLEKLMELQERWEKNEARKAFTTAKAAFKGEPIDIIKNKHVGFKSARGATDYDHATLDSVADVLSPALGKHGLSYSWETEQFDGGLIKVTCVLTHVMGHSERVSLQAAPDQTGNKNSIQAVGSTVTYLQRYTLLAATGMATKDQDSDAMVPDTKRVDEPTNASRLSTAPIPPGADDDLDARFAATVGDYEGRELGLPPVERDGLRPQHDEQTMTIYGKLLRATTDKKTPQAMQTWERHPKVVEARDSLPEDLRAALDKNIRTQLELMMAEAE